MDKLKVLHLVLTLRTGNECWEGNAFLPYPIPPGELWPMVDMVRRDLAATLPVLIDVNAQVRFALNAEVYTLSGPMADQMRWQMTQSASGNRPLILWDPIVGQRFNLKKQGGGANGEAK